MTETLERKKAVWALLLLVPAPTLGVLFGMYWLPDTGLGKGLFMGSKVWILLVPLVWHFVIYRQPFSWSPVRRGGLGAGLLLGVLISALIVGLFFLLGNTLIDPAALQASMQKVGLDRRAVYLAGAVYWITVNSLLEEVVWRWFVVQESEKLVGSRGAVVFSAFAFTVHHLFAMKIYLPWLTTWLCGLGIFVGGAIWSGCYIRYRSIWPGYLSHALVDLAVFGVGYLLIFG
jgi:membrane protease YdiL (CAAX protease family)